MKPQKNSIIWKMPRRINIQWSCDFETTTDPKDTRVWAWGCSKVGVDVFEYGNTIETFIQWCEDHSGCTLYFHNLKFDGEFIIYWLLTNGYTHVEEKHPTEDFQFTTLISDSGQFYTMEIQFQNEKTVRFIDSMKIIPFSVDKISETFDLETKKLNINYDEYREKGHELTDKEIAYLRNDVYIVSQALHVLFSQNLKKMTQGSNALGDYKKIVGKNFKRWFPYVEDDAQIRKAYKGGWTYVNPKFAGKTIRNGIVLDVNSLYPWVMYDRPLPWGDPETFEGKYEKDKVKPLFIQRLRCSFELKKGYLPMLQLKNNLSFIPTQYLESSEGEIVELTLTSVDCMLFFEHYDVEVEAWLGGWKFKQQVGMFKAYIDKWYEVKAQATIDGNEGLRTLAKLMQNALYGKFGTNPKVRSKIPYLAPEGHVAYRKGEEKVKKPVYIPIACFITAWARWKTITSAQKCIDRFIYADTDSLHLVGTEIPEGLEVDDIKLGAWKIESKFTRGKFLRAKTYVEEIDGELHVTCAGMPDQYKDLVTFKNFTYGKKFEPTEVTAKMAKKLKKYEKGQVLGKLVPLHVPGGIVLKPIDFQIRK